MNRIASLVAGTFTTALVSASIAAVSASQGILPIFDEAPKADASWSPGAEEMQVEWTAVAAASGAIEPGPAATPIVMYVDKPPIVITEQIIIPSSAAAFATVAPSVAPFQDGAAPAPPALRGGDTPVPLRALAAVEPLASVSEGAPVSPVGGGPATQKPPVVAAKPSVPSPALLTAAPTPVVAAEPTPGPSIPAVGSSISDDDAPDDEPGDEQEDEDEDEPEDEPEDEEDPDDEDGPEDEEL